jgi:hypothetical protein
MLLNEFLKAHRKVEHLEVTVPKECSLLTLTGTAAFRCALRDVKADGFLELEVEMTSTCITGRKANGATSLILRDTCLTRYSSQVA